MIKLSSLHPGQYWLIYHPYASSVRLPIVRRILILQVEFDDLYFWEQDVETSTSVYLNENWYDWRDAFTEEQPVFLTLLGESIQWRQLRGPTWAGKGPSSPCDEWYYNNIVIPAQVEKRALVLKALQETSINEDSIQKTIIQQMEHQQNWFRNARRYSREHQETPNSLTNCII